MMDSNLLSPPHDNSDAKNAFRKPSGDAASRNYRRRSPVEGSPSPDGSPKRERSYSPNSLKEDSARVSDHHSRKYDGREQDHQYGRNHYGRGSDTFRHSDRQSSRSSYGHSRHDKYVDEDRYREKLSSRSGHESRGDHVREESDSRSKDYQHTVDKYSRDKYDRSDYRSKEKDTETYFEHQKNKDKDSSYDRSGSGRRHAPYDEVERERRTRDRDGRDERRDSRRSFGDYRSDRAVSYSDSRSRRDQSGSQRDSGKYRPKESYKSEQKELDGQNLPCEEKRKHDDTEIGRDKDRNARGEQFGSEDKESSGKKPKLFGAGKDDNNGKYDERQTSSSKLSHEIKADSGTAKTSGFDAGNDIDAAKVAAMKAAELVNRNLVGVGCLTTDQKKKLLWGKKSATTEESGHRWDTAMFSDRDRQEKFNKLMSLRLYSCLWQIVGCERRSQSGAEFQQPKWKRCTPCREAEGTPAGSRETVHCRTPTKRWAYSWIRSLIIHSGKFTSFDIFYVLEYHSHMLRRNLSLVFSRQVWKFMYALMSAALSLGGCWEFVIRQGRVISTEYLILIVSNLLVLYSLYETGFRLFGFYIRNSI